jgi:hypothetical protein
MAEFLNIERIILHEFSSAKTELTATCWAIDGNNPAPKSFARRRAALTKRLWTATCWSRRTRGRFRRMRRLSGTFSAWASIGRVGSAEDGTRLSVP